MLHGAQLFRKAARKKAGKVPVNVTGKIFLTASRSQYRAYKKVQPAMNHITRRLQKEETNPEITGRNLEDKKL